MSINKIQVASSVFPEQFKIESKPDLSLMRVINMNNSAGQFVRLPANETKIILEKIMNTIIPGTYEANNIGHIKNKVVDEKDNHKNYFCDKMPLDFAYKGLKPLTSINRKNKRPFLSEEDYELFYQKAFLNDKSIEKLSLNSSGGNKGRITTFFYRFYREAVEKGYTPFKGHANLYKKLIIDNFEGWTEKALKGNFKEK